MPNQGYEPLLVRFDASNSRTCASGSLTYSWSFGDGSTAAGAITSHTFQQGLWTITLTVTNSMGISASISKPLNAFPALVPNMVFYLNFDQNVLDQSGRGAVVAWSNTSTYRNEAKFGSSASFSGVVQGSYITVRHNSNLDGMAKLTVSVWAKR
jgi:hypothetical protein